jgi:UDP-GlcNAc:undecaprenyl-phosphate GlcNAc-1-phosphate transferase
MFAVMHRRVKKGKSALTADRSHLHHIFMRFGFSAKHSLLIICSFAIFMAAFGLLGEYYNVPEFVMMAMFLLVFVVYDYAFMHIWKVSKFLRASLRLR